MFNLSNSYITLTSENIGYTLCIISHGETRNLNETKTIIVTKKDRDIQLLSFFSTGIIGENDQKFPMNPIELIQMPEIVDNNPRRVFTEPHGLL